MEVKHERKDELHQLLWQHTNCEIQCKGWPCRTCFYSLMDELKIPEGEQQELWQAVLLLRGDYRNGQYFLMTKDSFRKSIDELFGILEFGAKKNHASIS